MQSKREKIISAAIDLFAEKGFGNTSTAEIAAKSQVAHGTIFYHFKSKQGILYEVLRQILEKTSTAYKEIVADHLSGYACIEELLHREMTIVEQHSKEVMVLIRDMTDEIHSPDSQSHQLIKSFLEFKIDLLCDFLRKGIADNSIRRVPVEETAWFLDAALYGVMHSSLIKQLSLPFLYENAKQLCLTAIKSQTF